MYKRNAHKNQRRFVFVYELCGFENSTWCSITIKSTNQMKTNTHAYTQFRHTNRAIEVCKELRARWMLYLGADGIKNVIYEIVSVAHTNYFHLEMLSFACLLTHTQTHTHYHVIFRLKNALTIQTLQQQFRCLFIHFSFNWFHLTCWLLTITCELILR